MLSAALLTILLFLPFIPITIYVVGLLIPNTHVLTRTVTLRAPRSRVWELLTNVRNFPAWRTRVKAVTVMEQDSISFLTPTSSQIHTQQSPPAESVKVFRESTGHNHLTYRFVERNEFRRLVRLVDERDPGNHRMAFSGTWTFDLLPSGTPATPEPELQLQDLWHSAVEDEQECMLQITERGVVRRPIARFFGFFVFGYHRTVERFLKDLKETIENERKDKEADAADAAAAITKKEQEKAIDQFETGDVMVTDVIEKDAEAETTRLLQEEVAKAEAEADVDAEVETEAATQLDKSEYGDWDTVSEIYDRTKA
ncbi:hypothetical protein BC937DRAFT_87246 [Endogone sp. FLAS-F59071]|nr:hypothetical protein BC937DRAFT_87246 [Endogone sp. FLAS-F59071]|eukprot:RUS12688.1 hypothetical protein BC937DRAFT_87246 [Endogone sp. FLAS-F59071]